MSKTIVGLYDHAETAEKVIKALEQKGFERKNMHTAIHEEKGHRHTFAGGTDLADTISNYGVPEDEAMLYAEGVRRGGSLVLLRVSDEHASQVAEAMNQHQPVDVHTRRTSWQERGFKGYDRKANPFTRAEAEQERTHYRQAPKADATTKGTTEREERIELAEEELKVGKRDVKQGGIRIHTHVEEVPVTEQVRLRDEFVDVERRDVNRPVRADEDVFKERTIEMTETDEEAVVTKEAHVTGEVVARKGAEERTETVRDTVRRTDVDVERTGGAGAAQGRFEDLADAFRTHHRSTYSGKEFGTYEPAYRYGWTAASDRRHENREYQDLESDLRNGYEERHGKGSFEQVKDAIRHAFTHTRSQRRGNKTAGTTRANTTH